ncbi:MAG TPA: hypothetical protein VK841_17335 [Polyangiaceae bacterium]|jgi:hypothetical protein|nr:hypothetical protein [Polyangiaceae bacterium]
MASESPPTPDAAGVPLDRAAPDARRVPLDRAAPDAARAFPRARGDQGRLGIYAAMGAGTGTVPLPWVPEALARRVRGSLVHDVAVRHGMALETAAREALAARSAPGEKRGFVRQAVRFVGSTLAKRALTGLAPIGLVGPVRGALDTYVLGHLFDRYLTQRDRRDHSDEPAAPHDRRIGEDEARRVRKAIDSALLRALTVDVDAVTPPPTPPGARDARDGTTTFIDGVLSFAAGVPEQLIVRLDAAFDDIMQHELA